MVEGHAASPDGLPSGAGAEASVRYASKTRFGAVLIAQKPVTLTSYNDETLFRRWINNNRAKLAQLHGVELSRYGLLLVTRTYTAPKVSINAWVDKDKDASMSLKAKANMMGDLGGTVDWAERSSDKDWSHYSSTEGVVAFFDGIHIPAWQWYFNGVKARIRRDLGLAKKEMTLNRTGLGSHGTWRPSKHRDPRKSSAPGADDMYTQQSPISPVVRRHHALPIAKEEEKEPLPEKEEEQEQEEEDPPLEDIWGSSSLMRPVSPLSTGSGSRGRPHSVNLQSPLRMSSIPPKLSINLDSKGHSPQSDVTDPRLRLSTASTAAANAGIAITDHAVNDAARNFSDGIRSHELRRKFSSPSLRQSSPNVAYP